MVSFWIVGIVLGRWIIMYNLSRGADDHRAPEIYIIRLRRASAINHKTTGPTTDYPTVPNN